MPERTTTTTLASTHRQEGSKGELELFPETEPPPPPCLSQQKVKDKKLLNVIKKDHNILAQQEEMPWKSPVETLHSANIENDALSNIYMLYQ